MEVGDYYVYDLEYFFFIVICVVENDIRVYYNVCLYCGIKLCVLGIEGCVSEFCCFFYGWLWNIDGINKKIICEWDFLYVNKDEFKLFEVKVEMLGGFVFINMDDNVLMLVEYIGLEVMGYIMKWKFED